MGITTCKYNGPISLPHLSLQMIIFPVAATLREERLLLEKNIYIYVCIFLLHEAPDFYSQQSREQYLEKFIDS